MIANMGIIESAERELRRVTSLHSKLKNLIVDETDSILIGKENNRGNYEFFLQSKSTGKRVYIKKEDHGLILQLLQHRYGLESTKILENNLVLLETLLTHYQEYDPIQILRSLPKTYQYAQEFCKQKGLFQEPLPGKTRFGHSEKTNSATELKHTTTFGLKTRSKGEAMISEALFHYTNVTFYYEKKLTLLDSSWREVDVYPDFTIIQSQEEAIYWENKGMLSDPEYVKMDQRKMELYFQNGIYAPKNLIVTCDGPDGSTDLQSIMKLIDGYFGCAPGPFQ